MLFFESYRKMFGYAEHSLLFLAYKHFILEKMLYLSEEIAAKKRGNEPGKVRRRKEGRGPGHPHRENRAGQRGLS